MLNAGESLKLFRLVPVAAPNDSNWDVAENMGEVVVRAFSPADARVVAAQAELDFTEINSMPAEETRPAMQAPSATSGFMPCESKSRPSISGRKGRAALSKARSLLRQSSRRRFCEGGSLPHIMRFRSAAQK